ncbi:MAG: DNA polymerase III subunit delta', partial [Elusimicrobia bacterium]|nr:DNA polymerase III subunit delta' [Elusimicrobiota bacterium]
MSFNDITGHAKTLSIIRKQVNQNKVPHAYLFVGPSGVGKKKTAVELAKSLNCIGSAKAP